MLRMPPNADMHGEPGAGGRHRRALRRAVCNPFTTAALVALLILDARSVMTPGPPNRSVLGGWLSANLALGARSTWFPGRSDDLYVLQDPGGLRVIDPESESWDELSAILSRGDTPVASVHYLPTTTRSGLWALTTETERRVPRIEPLVGGADRWNEEMRRRVLERFADHLRTSGRSWQARDADIVARGGVTSHRPLWGGYLHNALSIALLAAFLASLAWVPRVPSWRRERRRLRAVSRGRCPWCGYSVVGLEEGVCPECGRTREG